MVSPMPFTRAFHSRGESEAAARDAIESHIRRNLDPASLGLAFRDVRAEAVAAAEGTTDFGQLFLGLSFFLIIAAVLLPVCGYELPVAARMACSLLQPAFTCLVALKVLFGKYAWKGRRYSG